MSKGTPNKKVVDLTRFSKSTFTLTFAIEILGIDVWHDCNEGWLDLGPCHQAIKIQYLLYPEQNYDLDILIWPHVAKIWCGGQYGYVRTWQFLERRWFAFSIRHAFPVRVLDLMNHVATINCAMGFNAISNNAKNDKNIEAFLPHLKFGEKRYFAVVLEKEETLENFVQEMLWSNIGENIPASYLDGTFNTPQNVTDKRHQDKILYDVKEIILKSKIPFKEEVAEESVEFIKPKNRRESKTAREKEKKKVIEVQKEKFVISLSGDALLAGTGKVISFESTGERPQDQGNVVVLISTSNLPGYDDMPIIFVNIENLYGLPIGDFKMARIAQIYTRWKLNDEEHDSQKLSIKPGLLANFNDHHTVPLQASKAYAIIATFLDKPFEIQLRGIQSPEIVHSHEKLFGNDKKDRNFDFKISFDTRNDNADLLIAVTKIDASALARNNSGVVAGEFSLYPSAGSREKINRIDISTNDINSVKISETTNNVIPPFVILDAHMTIDVSIGLVGCKPCKIGQSYSRLYCLAHDSEAAKDILEQIIETNNIVLATNDKNNLLTGFALGTGNMVIFYIEGQKDGPITNIWELTGHFYPKIKPLFSCSEHYLDRIYSEMIEADIPFDISQMFVPLNTLLGCPQVYVKHTLPMPAKSALLKIGRLVVSHVKSIPHKSEMPTNEELKSFRLELCVPSRPDLIMWNIV